MMAKTYGGNPPIRRNSTTGKGSGRLPPLWSIWRRRRAGGLQLPRTRRPLGRGEPLPRPRRARPSRRPRCQPADGAGPLRPAQRTPPGPGPGGGSQRRPVRRRGRSRPGRRCSPGWPGPGPTTRRTRTSAPWRGRRLRRPHGSRAPRARRPGLHQPAPAHARHGRTQLPPAPGDRVRFLTRSAPSTPASRTGRPVPPDRRPCGRSPRRSHCRPPAAARRRRCHLRCPCRGPRAACSGGRGRRRARARPRRRRWRRCAPGPASRADAPPGRPEWQGPRRPGGSARSAGRRGDRPGPAPRRPPVWPCRRDTAGRPARRPSPGGRSPAAGCAHGRRPASPRGRRRPRRASSSLRCRCRW